MNIANNGPPSPRYFNSQVKHGQQRMLLEAHPNKADETGSREEKMAAA